MCSIEHIMENEKEKEGTKCVLSLIHLIDDHFIAYSVTNV